MPAQHGAGKEKQEGEKDRKVSGSVVKARWLRVCLGKDIWLLRIFSTLVI